MRMDKYELEVVTLFPINIRLSLYTEEIAGDRGTKIPKGLSKGDKYTRKNFIGYYGNPSLILRAMKQYEVAIAIDSAENISELRLALDNVGFTALNLSELSSEIRDLREEQKLRNQIEEATEQLEAG